jgi:hypothetical protein
VAPLDFSGGQAMFRSTVGNTGTLANGQVSTLDISNAAWRSRGGLSLKSVLLHGEIEFLAFNPNQSQNRSITHMEKVML